MFYNQYFYHSLVQHQCTSPGRVQVITFREGGTKDPKIEGRRQYRCDPSCVVLTAFGQAPRTLERRGRGGGDSEAAFMLYLIFLCFRDYKKRRVGKGDERGTPNAATIYQCLVYNGLLLFNFKLFFALWLCNREFIEYVLISFQTWKWFLSRNRVTQQQFSLVSAGNVRDRKRGKRKIERKREIDIGYERKREEEMNTKPCLENLNLI